MIYFDLSQLKFSLNWYTESVKIPTAIVTTVWHLQPLRKCDFKGKFSANEAEVETKNQAKSFARSCQWT